MKDHRESRFVSVGSRFLLAATLVVLGNLPAGKESKARMWDGTMSLSGSSSLQDPFQGQQVQVQEGERQRWEIVEVSSRMQPIEMPMPEPLPVLSPDDVQTDVVLPNPPEPIWPSDSLLVDPAVLSLDDYFRSTALARHDFLPAHPVVNVWAWILTVLGITEDDLLGERSIHGGVGSPAVALQLAARACIDGCAGDAATLARSRLAAACDAGAPLACYAAGRLLMPETGEQPGQKEARFMRRARNGFEAACRLGDPVACYGLGVQQEQGEGGSMNPADAAGAYSQACLLGYSPGCRGLVRLALDADGLPLSEDEKSRLQERADILSRSTGLDASRLRWGPDEEGAPSGSFQEDDSDLYQEGHPAALFNEAVQLADSMDEEEASRARDLLSSLCDQGMPQACHNLAVLLVFEESLEGEQARDPAKARILFGRACDAGLPVSCHGLATQMMEGAGGDRDTEKALSLDRIACEGGDAGGCYDVAVLLYHKNGSGARTDRKAEAWLRRACTLGLPFGCLQLARLLEKAPTTPERLTEARAVLERSCQQDLSSGCTLLGYFWDYGIGGSSLDTRARELYQKACDLGDPAGCNNLGVCNRYGQGGAINRAEAIRLFEQACEEGIPDACRNRGEIEFGPAELTPDKAQARSFFEKACSAGDPEGCHALAGMLYHGDGGPRDRPHARERFLRNCAEGFIGSCRTAGYFWNSGDTGPVDLLEGEKALRKACDAEDSGACMDLAEIWSRRDMPANRRKRVAEGYRKARMLLEKACAEGDGDACMEASDLRREGKGGPADPARGDALLADACRAGSGEGCFQLARRADAHSIPNSEGAAIRWHLAAACEVGHAEGCLQLGTTWWMGWWGPMDRSKARTHLADACRYGDLRGCGCDVTLRLLDAISQWAIRLRSFLSSSRTRGGRMWNNLESRAGLFLPAIHTKIGIEQFQTVTHFGPQHEFERPRYSPKVRFQTGESCRLAASPISPMIRMG